MGAVPFTRASAGIWLLPQPHAPRSRCAVLCCACNAPHARRRAVLFMPLPCGRWPSLMPAVGTACFRSQCHAHVPQRQRMRMSNCCTLTDRGSTSGPRSALHVHDAPAPSKHPPPVCGGRCQVRSACRALPLCSCSACGAALCPSSALSCARSACCWARTCVCVSSTLRARVQATLSARCPRHVPWRLCTP